MAEFIDPRVFNTTEAIHFCSWPGGTVTVPPESYKRYIRDVLRPGQLIGEPSPGYEAFRCHALREADRALFLALSNYRRSLDLLTESSAAWAWVTTYYSAFFSASAILGLLGVSLDPFQVVVGVKRGSPGSQELTVQEFSHEVTKAQGTHEAFWEMFDRLIGPVRREFPHGLQDATRPHDEGVDWQIKMRNTQNYDTFAAVDTGQQLRGSFQKDRFPRCLTGNFALQFEKTVGLANVSLWLAHHVGLSTDALDGLYPTRSIRQKTEALVGRARSPFPIRPMFRAGAARSPLTLLL
jgi:hypothetical protein